MVDMEWGFTTPTSCAVSPASSSDACTTSASLSSFATDGWVTIAAPDPGETQTSTLTTSRDPTYNVYVSGLQLYAPIVERDQTLQDNVWSVTFSWSNATAAFIA
jgi:hypothetical protein